MLPGEEPDGPALDEDAPERGARSWGLRVCGWRVGKRHRLAHVLCQARLLPKPNLHYSPPRPPRLGPFDPLVCPTGTQSPHNKNAPFDTRRVAFNPNTVIPRERLLLPRGEGPCVLTLRPQRPLRSYGS